MSSGETATSLIPVPVAALTRPEIVRGLVGAMSVAGLAVRDGLGGDDAEGVEPVGAGTAVGEKLAAGAVSAAGAAGAAQAAASASVAQNLANPCPCRRLREQVAGITLHHGRARRGDPHDGPPRATIVRLTVNKHHAT